MSWSEGESLLTPVLACATQRRLGLTFHTRPVIWFMESIAPRKIDVPFGNIAQSHVLIGARIHLKHAANTRPNPSQRGGRLYQGALMPILRKDPIFASRYPCKRNLSRILNLCRLNIKLPKLIQEIQILKQIYSHHPTPR